MIMPGPAGSPAWLITLVACTAGVLCQAQVAAGQGHIRISRSTNTGSAHGGPAQRPVFGTKASGFGGGHPVLNSGNGRREFPLLPGTGVGTTGNNERGAIARPGSSPSGFPERTGFRVPSRADRARDNDIRTGSASFRSPQHPGFSDESSGTGIVEGDVLRNGIAPNGLPWRPDSNAGASEVLNGNRPSGFPRRPESSVQGGGHNFGGTIMQPSGFPRRPGSYAGPPVLNDNMPGGLPQRADSSVQGSGNDFVGTAMQPSGFPRRSGSTWGTSGLPSGNRANGRPDSSVQGDGNNFGGSAIQPSGSAQHPEANVPRSSNTVGGNIASAGGIQGGFPHRPNSGVHTNGGNVGGTIVRPSIGPGGFPNRPGLSGGGPGLRTGHAPNESPQSPDSHARIRVNNVGGTAMGTGNVPNGFPKFSGSDIRTNGNVEETFIWTNGMGIRLPQQPHSVAPESGSIAIRTNKNPGGFKERLGFGLDKITNSAGVKILQEEAPMIHEIETKMHEGREMESNLTAIRDAIRQEIAGDRGIGIIRRIKMKRQLGELEFRIRELHGKNQEGEARFRAFISGVSSGEIRDRRSARSVLGTIFNFYGTIVSRIITICRGFAGGIINIYKRIFLGVGGVIHRLLALKLAPLEAGINIISGI